MWLEIVASRRTLEKQQRSLCAVELVESFLLTRCSFAGTPEEGSQNANKDFSCHALKP